MKFLPFVLSVPLLFCCGLADVEAAYPMIYGVTQGSRYTVSPGANEYVRIYWFNGNAEATLSVDGGDPEPYAMKSEISADGNYRIELTVTEGGETFVNAVDFEIDSREAPSLITHEDPALTGLSITLEPGDYIGTPIIVIWLEDMAGNFLQNLYVSNAAATNYMRFTNNMVKRPQAVPYWAHKACPAGTDSYGDTIYLADPATPLPEGLDGVSGATQKTGFQLDTHVIPPAEGARVKVMLEINQSFDDGWYFAPGNEVDLDEEPDGVLVEGQTYREDRYYYGSNEPSLVYEVVVSLDQPGTESTSLPVGYGHYGGRTGTLYTDFTALDGDTERYKFDHAHRMVGQITVTVHELAGDISGDFVVDLQDAVTGLKLCGGENVPANINADVGNDEKIDLKDVLFIMKQGAE